MEPNVVTLEERLWARVEQTDECWWWRGATTARGYGKIGVKIGGAKTLLTHRVAWEVVNGPIPHGMQVCHHCDNPGCVNPDHLFLGTQSDNLKDMYAKGRDNHWQRTKTSCKNEHEFTAENTYLRPDGTRACMTCRQAAVLRYRKRLTDEAL